MQSTPEATKDEYVYIDLDRPTHWWNSLIGVVALVLIVGVLIAPWIIDLDDENNNSLANTTLQSSSSVCRPNNAGLPSFFDPTVASWSRFCDWFIEPDADTP